MGAKGQVDPKKRTQGITTGDERTPVNGRVSTGGNQSTRPHEHGTPSECKSSSGHSHNEETLGRPTMISDCSTNINATLSSASSASELTIRNIPSYSTSMRESLPNPIVLDETKAHPGSGGVADLGPSSFAGGGNVVICPSEDQFTQQKWQQYHQQQSCAPCSGIHNAKNLHQNRVPNMSQACMTPQNAVGSLIVPGTWRYAPPPAPPKQQALPASAKANDRNGDSTLDGYGLGRIVIKSLKERQAPSPADLDKAWPQERMTTQAKMQLLGEIIECLANKTQTAEQDLSSQRRANRAMHSAFEVLQRQNLCQQQQIAWIAQGWSNAGLSWEPAEEPATMNFSR